MFGARLTIASFLLLIVALSVALSVPSNPESEAEFESLDSVHQVISDSNLGFSILFINLFL